MARRPLRRIERQRGAENLDSFTQPRVTTKAFREPTLGLHLVDEVVVYFVLFWQGLQHGPDFVELGPRDGGVQRFARGLFHVQRDPAAAGRRSSCPVRSASLGRSAAADTISTLLRLGVRKATMSPPPWRIDPFRQAARVRSAAVRLLADRAALNSVIKPSRAAVDIAPLTCNAAKSGR